MAVAVASHSFIGSRGHNIMLNIALIENVQEHCVLLLLGGLGPWSNAGYVPALIS